MTSHSSPSNIWRFAKRYVESFRTLVRLEGQSQHQYQNDIPHVTVRKPKAPTAIPMFQILINLPKLFPLTVTRSFEDYNQFTINPERFQHELLSLLPYYPEPNSEYRSRIVKTVIDDDGNFINEFEICPLNCKPSDPNLKHIIFVHGYGAGLGFFIKNFKDLLDSNTVIHAIDLPGYGYSSRPFFPFKYPHDSHLKVENYFHDILNNWFQKRNLISTWQNNYVIAHSMGAYLFSLYANKKRHFKKLFMCSPGGISRCNSKSSPPWWFVKLWDRNISPFTLVRNSSALGSKIVSGWSARRFGLTHTYFKQLHRYTYGIFNQKGSGEYMLAFLLGCGGWPRYPLDSRLFTMENFKATHLDWVWLYGDEDWMDVNGGKRVNDFLLKNGVNSKLAILPNSGHHVYWDNEKEFNNIIKNELNIYTGNGNVNDIK